MRIVHINYDGAKTGGASIAMLRMHNALRSEGHESLIACRVLAEEEGASCVTVSRWNRFLILCGKVLTKVLSGSCHSTGMFRTGMAEYVNSLKPDLVLLHWLQTDTISIGELKKIKSPIAWYHHDFWPIRGLTAHEWFPVPRNLGWLDKIVKWHKRREIKKLGRRITPVCASKWVARQIDDSGIFVNKARIVPLVIDPCFKTGKRNPHKKFRILNGARGGFEEGLKGGDRLLAALKLLPDEVKQNTEMVVFGSKGDDEVREGISVHYVGRLTGEDLAQQYRDADVFAFPSRQETFGQTKLEALACGTPVIAFDETACAEGIEHGKNGYVASVDDIKNYSEGLMAFYEAFRSSGECSCVPLNVVTRNMCFVDSLTKLVAWDDCDDLSFAWWNTSVSPYGGTSTHEFSDIRGQLHSLLDSSDVIALGEFDKCASLRRSITAYNKTHPDRMFLVESMIESSGKCEQKTCVCYRESVVEILETKSFFKPLENEDAKNYRVGQRATFRLKKFGELLDLYIIHWRESNDKKLLDCSAAAQTILHYMNESSGAGRYVICLGDCNLEPFDSPIQAGLQSTRSRKYAKDNGILCNLSWGELGDGIGTLRMKPEEHRTDFITVDQAFVNKYVLRDFFAEYSIVKDIAISKNGEHYPIAVNLRRLLDEN